MARMRGRTYFAVDGDDDVLANTVDIVRDDGVVQLKIGAVDGSDGGRKPLVSESRDVNRWHQAIEQEARWHQGRYRKANPVPKPATQGKKRAKSTSAAVCSWCGGAGEYEAGDGFWVECQHCKPSNDNE